MEHGILTVTETITADLEANGAILHLTITAERFVYGNAALEACAEVRAAVAAIRTGDPQAEVVIVAVTAKSVSGWLSKASKGTYRLQARLSGLELLGKVLGAVLELKNVALDGLEWRFDEDVVRLDLLPKAMVKARQKALVMAAALDIALVGIHAVAESISSPDGDVRPRAVMMGDPGVDHLHDAMPRRAVDIGTELKGRKEMRVTARIEYLIANPHA